MTRDGKNRWLHAITGLALMAGTFACTVGSAAPTKPTVVITYPQAGAQSPLGQEMVVQSVSAVSSDGKGIARVDLAVDGTVVHSQAVDPAATSYTASQPWVPNSVGSHIVEIRAYNTDNVSSDPAQVTVTIVDAAATATPAVSPPAAEGTPGGVEQASGAALVTALIGLNVRSGPGTEYEIIGGLPAGNSAEIVGRNPEGTWWKIVYPAGSSGVGWVSAKQQYSQAVASAEVPVVETPVPPPVLPTATPLPPQGWPTPTPLPPQWWPTATPWGQPPYPPPTAWMDRPVIYQFAASKYAVSPGESVVLYWDLANAQAAYLYYGSAVEGVVAPGSKVVAPFVTTTYKLVAYNGVGETTAYVTIAVSSPVYSTVVVDFIASAPFATWTSAWGAHVLPWDGSVEDSRGFVKWRVDEKLEDGHKWDRVLETHPQWVPDGHIFGTYLLPRPVQVGDRFRGKVGFLKDAPGAVNFSVVVMGGALAIPATVVSVPDSGEDGVLRPIDADLSAAAGGTTVVLVVQAGPTAYMDWAVWAEATLVH